MQGLNKTKAALQGRQCHYRKIKPSQITTLIDQVNSGHKLTAPLAQLIRDTCKSAHTGNSTDLKSLATWWMSPNLDRPQPIDISDFPQWGKSTPMADTLSRKSSLAAHSSGASLAFLRWRRLISPLAAAIKKPAVLSSFSLTCSINSKSSSGSLTETCRDLLFRLPVAITESPYLRWCSVCTKYLSFQALTWCSPYNTLVVFTLFVARCKNSEAPQVIATPAGPLTTNDR